MEIKVYLSQHDLGKWTNYSHWAYYNQRMTWNWQNDIEGTFITVRDTLGHVIVCVMIRRRYPRSTITLRGKSLFLLKIFESGFVINYPVTHVYSHP